jgi:hypothetical protein
MESKRKKRFIRMPLKGDNGGRLHKWAQPTEVGLGIGFKPLSQATSYWLAPFFVDLTDWLCLSQIIVWISDMGTSPELGFSVCVPFGSPSSRIYPPHSICSLVFLCTQVSIKWTSTLHTVNFEAGLVKQSSEDHLPTHFTILSLNSMSQYTSIERVLLHSFTMLLHVVALGDRSKIHFIGYSFYRKSFL